MKKLFFFATALLMSASMFAKTSVITYTASEKLPETTKEGDSGLNLNAFYAADNTQLTVTHTFDEAESVGTITLDGELAIIGNEAFFETELTSVTIPEGVTTIGSYAFSSCSNLQSPTFPASLITIDDYAFSFCFAVTFSALTIPASVTTIGRMAFQCCGSVASVTFEGNACQEGIDEFAFTGVGSSSKPATLILPANWTGSKPDEGGNWCGGKFNLVIADPVVGEQFLDTISGLKFEITAVGETNTVKVTKNSYAGTTYTVPAKVSYKSVDFAVTTIGTDAFFDCQSLTSITLPEGLTTLEEMAFQNCQSLQSVTLPEGLTTIGEYDFECCFKLKSITIPASVTTIGIGAFGNCTVLASVTFKGNACQEGIGEGAFPGVGEETPALLTLPDNWTGTKPDEDGNWYGGKFKLNDTALPQMRAAVKATKVLTNGQVIFRAENKNYSVLGQEVR